MLHIFKFHKYKYLLGMLLIVLGFTLPLFVFEIAFRMFGPDWLDLRMREISLNENVFFDTDYGWPIECNEIGCYKFVPNSEFLVSTNEYSHSVHIGSDGYRLNGNRISDFRKTIPFVGDSFTFGVGVEDHQTFVSILERDSNNRYLNIGIPGNSIVQQIDIVKKRHDDLGRPNEYVFVFFLGNDFQNILESRLLAPGTYSNNIDLEDEEVDYYPTVSNNFSILATINQFVIDNRFLRELYTVQWLRHKVLILVNQSNADLMDPIFLMMRKDKEYLYESKSIFVDELRRLDDLADALDFQYAFLIVPDRHQIDSDLLKIRMDYYGIDSEDIDYMLPNNVLSILLDEHQITYIDPTECMKTQDNVNELFYILDNHLTVKGHATMAKCVGNSINDKLE
ncbi:MAG TPA: hypothetical protein DCL76_07850 [Chloroflexi bacterium]|nr:hypothetical protein [Chloroflexota bacterium]